VTGHRDYSGTPLPAKLGVREGTRLKVLGAPAGFPLAGRTRKPVDVAVLFTRRRADLERRFAQLAEQLAPSGGLWVAYPKQASGEPTDLSFAAVQEIGLEAGLVDNKSCAIDDVWTAVRFVYRLRDR
jgi:Protein of unknown function (DUF3052)